MRRTFKAGEALLSFKVDSWQNGIKRNVDGRTVRRVLGYNGNGAHFRRTTDEPKAVVTRNSRSVKVGKPDYERTSPERAATTRMRRQPTPTPPAPLLLDLVGEQRTRSLGDDIGRCLRPSHPPRICRGAVPNQSWNSAAHSTFAPWA
jgi:hypothetical protein